MNILEKEIEEVIFEAAAKDTAMLRERGLPVKGLVYRQVRLDDYGIADMISFYFTHDYIYAQVIEIKKEQINIATLLQAARYAKGVEDYVHTHYGLYLRKRRLQVRIILVGKTVDLSSEFMHLIDFIFSAKVFTYKIDLQNGVRFIEQTLPITPFGVSTPRLNLCLRTIKSAYYNG